MLNGVLIFVHRGIASVVVGEAGEALSRVARHNLMASGVSRRKAFEIPLNGSHAVRHRGCRYLDRSLRIPPSGELGKERPVTAIDSDDAVLEKQK